MHTSTTPLLSNGIGYSALSPPMSVSASTICHKVPSNGNLLATLSHDSPALFAVGGGASGLPRGSNTALSAFGSSTAVVEAQAQDATVARDSSQTVVHNGRKLTFADYRRPSLLEQIAVALAAFTPAGWRIVSKFQSKALRTTWAKALEVVVSTSIGWALWVILAKAYKQVVLKPRLLPAEAVAFANSRFEEIDDVKVHSIWEFPSEQDPGVQQRSVLHLNHGFGASTSSWAGVMEQLSRRLDAVAVAHDTPGFGLTSRPSLRRIGRYSLGNNAAITGHMARKAARELEAWSKKARTSRLGYIFAGHSMGCISAAMAATDSALSPRDVTLVLVAPILAPRRGEDHEEASEPGGAGGESLSGGGESVGGIGNVLMRALKVVLGVPSFGLRLVGEATAWAFNRVFLSLVYPGVVVALRALANSENLWRKGLRAAWFDKEAVDMGVINRYRWPTLVERWDRGIALVLLERLRIGEGGPTGPPGLVGTIAAKARQGMKVIVVQGESDKLVSLDRIRKSILDVVPGAKLVLMPRCGHVPHEEQPDTFVRVLLGALGVADSDQDKGD